MIRLFDIPCSNLVDLRGFPIQIEKPIINCTLI